MSAGLSGLDRAVAARLRRFRLHAGAPGPRPPLRSVLRPARTVRGRRSEAGVDVLDPDDIVFAEIRPRLDLYQVQRQPAGVFEAVNAPQRQIDRLVLAHEVLLVVARDQRGAVDDDPMLGPM